MGNTLSAITSKFTFLDWDNWFKKEIPQMSEEIRNFVFRNYLEAEEILKNHLNKNPTSHKYKDWLDEFFSSNLLLNYWKAAGVWVETIMENDWGDKNQFLLENTLGKCLHTLTVDKLEKILGTLNSQINKISKSDYPKIGKITENYNTTITSLEEERSELYDLTKNAFEKFAPLSLLIDKIEKQKNESYLPEFPEIVEKIYLYQVQETIKELDECCKEKKIDYKEIRHDPPTYTYKYKEEIKNISWKELENYKNLVIDYLDDLAKKKKKTGETEKEKVEPTEIINHNNTTMEKIKIKKIINFKTEYKDIINEETSSNKRKRNFKRRFREVVEEIVAHYEVKGNLKEELEKPLEDLKTSEYDENKTSYTRTLKKFFTAYLEHCLNKYENAEKEEKKVIIRVLKQFKKPSDYNLEDDIKVSLKDAFRGNNELIKETIRDWKQRKKEKVREVQYTNRTHSSPIKPSLSKFPSDPSIKTHPKRTGTDSSTYSLPPGLEGELREDFKKLLEKTKDNSDDLAQRVIKLGKRVQKAKEESDKLISNSKERLKDIMPKNGKLDADPLKFDELTKTRNVPTVEKEEVVKKTLTNEAEELTNQLLPYIERIQKNKEKLKNIGFLEGEIINEDVWKDNAFDIHETYKSVDDDFWSAINVCLVNANKTVETAVKHVEEKLDNKEKLEYEEHIKELGNKIIELDGTNKTLTKEKNEARNNADNSNEAARTAGEKLLEEEGKVNDLTTKNTGLTNDLKGAEDNINNAVREKNEYLNVLKSLKKNKIDVFRVSVLDEEPLYNETDENKLANLLVIRNAAVELKIASEEGNFNQARKNQIDARLGLLETIHTQYGIFKDDGSGDIDNGKVARINTLITGNTELKKLWENLRKSIEERNVKLAERIRELSEDKRRTEWGVIKKTDSNENSFKTLLDNYEILYTKQNEKADRADKYEEKIKNLLTTRTTKDGREVSEVLEDWEDIWETEFIGFKTDAEIKRKHDIDELNRIIKEALAESSDEEMEEIPDEDAYDTNERLVKKTLGSKEGSFARASKAKRFIRDFLDTDLSKHDKEHDENNKWEKVVENLMKVNKSLGIDKDNVADFQNVLSGTTSIEVSDDNTKNTKLGGFLSQNVSFTAARINTLKYLRKFKGDDIADKVLDEELGEEWTETIETAGDAKQLAERANIIYKFVLKKNENLELTTAKNERDAANKIITDAKNNLGVNDLKDDLTAKLGGKKLTDIIKERDDANTDKTTAEKARDTAIGERDTHKNNLDKWTTNFKTDADTAKKGYDKAVSDLATEKTDHDKTKDDLKNWTDKFGTDADAVQTELTTAERDRDYYAQILKDDIGYDPATLNWDNNLRGRLGGRKVNDIASTLNDLLVHDGEINKLKTRLDIITILTDNEVKNKLKNSLGIEDLKTATLNLKLGTSTLKNIPAGDTLTTLIYKSGRADTYMAERDNERTAHNNNKIQLTNANNTITDAQNHFGIGSLSTHDLQPFKDGLSEANRYKNYLQSDLKITDLHNLPNNDTGQSLTILIHHYKNTPTQGQIDDLQSQLNQEKQGCQKNCQTKIDNKVKEIIQKINIELDLKLTNKLTLEQVIIKIKELLRRPDNSAELANLQNQLKQANQTIAVLQEKLANTEKLKIIKQTTIQIIEKIISQKAARELSDKLKNSNDYQTIKDSEKEIIAKYLTNKEVCQNKKDKLTKQMETERTIFVVLLLTSLLTISGLIYKLKTSSRKK